MREAGILHRELAVEVPVSLSLISHVPRCRPVFRTPFSTVQLLPLAASSIMASVLPALAISTHPGGSILPLSRFALRAGRLIALHISRRRRWRSRSGKVFRILTPD